MKIFLILLGICLVIGIGLYWEQKRLCVRRCSVKIPQLPKGWDGVRFVHISDLHRKELGEYNAKILERAKQEQPEYIFLTGDSISRDVTDYSRLCRFLQGLSQIAPVYVGVGNHELEQEAGQFALWKKAVTESGCRVLDNETIVLERNGDKLYVTGASLRYGMYRDENWSFRHLLTFTKEMLEEDIGTRQGCTLMLAHNPLCGEVYAQWGADVVLSGHVHGGAIYLPVIGGLLSPERKFFPKYDKGVFKVSSLTMLVSGGIGKLRVGNPSEIGSITLTREEM